MPVVNATYASKSTAARGAKRAGIANAQIVPLENGRFELRDLDRPIYNGSKRARSKVDGPVSVMWDLLCACGQRLSRKEVIAKAVDAGVNINTARTQYTIWKNTEKK